MEIKTYKLEEQDRYVDFRSYEDGVYFGDPCYVVPGWDADVDLWDRLCDKMFEKVTRKHPDTGEDYTSREEPFDSRNNVRVVEMDKYGAKFYMWSTSYGDGCYPITLNNKLLEKVGVDAGCLSIIPMSLINRWGNESEAKRLGYVYDGPGLAGYLSVEEGDMHWNNWDILTGGLDEDEDDDDECYWSDQDEEMYG